MKTKFGQNAAVNVKTSINSSPPQSILSPIGKVVDVILDDSHPLYKEYGGENSIGVIFVVDNILSKNKQIPSPAFPLIPGDNFIPLINELVYLSLFPSPSSQSDTSSVRYYYSPPINIWNTPHQNALPLIVDNSSQKKDYLQVERGLANYFSQIDSIKLGSTFIEKNNIHPLQPFEGDKIIEGRWGQSIRFGSTVLNKNSWSTSGKNGEPILIIRNGQGLQNNEAWQHILEDINKDEASLYFTTTQKIPIEVANDNYNNYFKIPTSPKEYISNQIIITSGRLLFNSNKDDILFSSFKSIGLNANEDVILQAENVVVGGSKNYIGSKNASQPLLKGKDTVNTLNAVLLSLKGVSDALIALAEILPSVPNAPINIAAAELSVELEKALVNLPKLLSKNNFTE